MNYAAIKKNDIANGPGVRTSLFVSGCRHRCRNCFNSEAWDFSYGKPFTEEVREEILSSLSPDHIAGLSLLGGEPFEPENREALTDLARRFKERFPQKSLWCYTGFDFQHDFLGKKISGYETAEALLQQIDVLVDGKFIEEKKNPALLFRGSENQTIIDVKKSLAAGEKIPLAGKWERTMGGGNIYQD